MNIYSVDFDPMYPVPSCLIIAAHNEEEALTMAKKTVVHTNVKSIQQIDISSPCVVLYQDGDY